MPKSRRKQVAALPWRQGESGLEILLVTSRISRHWLIPKGWPIADRSPSDAAATEAFEEAGAVGLISATPIGHYAYDKIREGKPALPCLVDVYPLKVQRFVDDYKERMQREHRWFSPEEAADAVYERDLARFIDDFARTYLDLPTNSTLGIR